tara:strand:- start:3202 stop:3402 length:201 start_codon:yes stop_codon:yes gene_type:complete
LSPKINGGIKMSEPWLEEPYDMNDYYRDNAPKLCKECHKTVKKLLEPVKNDYLLLEEVIHRLTEED